MRKNTKKNIPLADRMRPSSFEDFFGQEEVVGKDNYLHRSIEKDIIPSIILWGPPGTGKTTLAHIIAEQSRSSCMELSAVQSGKKQLLEIVKKAQELQETGKRTILFIDEIHRWNKAQQDALLPYVEHGVVTLIGATTENPSFEVISALLSRCRVLVLKQLSVEDIEKILARAIKDKKVGYGNKKVTLKKDALEFLARFSNGDARMALNTLEVCLEQSRTLSVDNIKTVLQKSHLLYDKGGEEHYNIISALHKSMRGGDADAAVYWLARMLEGGEDPIYIARRLVRFASEDVGLANNTALLLANAVFESCQKLGMPECNVHLTQCVIYLSKSKKDIASYLAYSRARKDVEKYGNLSVPLHIRNAPTKLMKDLGYGKDYKYTPLEDSGDQVYLPEELKGKKCIH
jgi:putative ATPase